MCGEPLLLSPAIVNSFLRREVRDGHVDALLLDERKRFKRAKQPVFEYSFQFADHDLIVAGDSDGFRTISRLSGVSPASPNADETAVHAFMGGCFPP